ncbi:DUF7835 family putative zinc beta-ribbon protein [Halorhabdus amylolytica]|uniref:DUF7835 family putative zinc beta-ribbon protein n=1 Tax=Halorhabdus amylolytica TaxID=2559573 RepID=UPI0010A99DB4|nr:hypothetical protein [Halorhabdus amylolytica]
MASTPEPTDRMAEYCPTCRAERPHDVSVTLVTESDTTANAAYSREPYRVSECLDCGRRTERRMNDA